MARVMRRNRARPYSVPRVMVLSLSGGDFGRAGTEFEDVGFFGADQVNEGVGGEGFWEAGQESRLVRRSWMPSQPLVNRSWKVNWWWILVGVVPWSSR